MFVAYQTPETFPYGSKVKVLAAATLADAMADLVAAKTAEGFEVLACEADGDAAADAAFAKAGAITLFTIEAEG